VISGLKIVVENLSFFSCLREEEEEEKKGRKERSRREGRRGRKGREGGKRREGESSTLP
jgi:hypothetical protein